MRLLLLIAAGCWALPTGQQMRGESDWYVGEWGECSAECGDSGVRRRSVFCHRINATSGEEYRVKELNCLHTPLPAHKQQCNRFACPAWHTTEWSVECSYAGRVDQVLHRATNNMTITCGTGINTREVTCRRQNPEDNSTVGASLCSGERPSANQTCVLPACEGLRYDVIGEWKSLADMMLNDNPIFGLIRMMPFVSWMEHRNVSCVDVHGVKHLLQQCDEVSQKKELTMRAHYKWEIGGWSECSNGCGRGVRTRNVTCHSNYYKFLMSIYSGAPFNTTSLDELETMFEENTDEMIYETLVSKAENKDDVTIDQVREHRSTVKKLSVLFSHRHEGCRGLTPASSRTCLSEDACPGGVGLQLPYSY